MNNNKILIVDDEETVINPLKLHLEKEGFSIISAKDGVQGLNIAMNDKPNLIILDISMPNMNGLEMMKKLRSDDQYGKNVKLILLTALSADDTIIKAIVEGTPSFFLDKSNSTIQMIVDKAKEALGI
jgi:DNA-binding response OmpR family regulator